MKTASFSSRFKEKKEREKKMGLTTLCTQSLPFKTYFVGGSVAEEAVQQAGEKEALH